MVTAASLLLLQGSLLLGIVLLARAGVSKSILFGYLNPACFVAFFATTFFVVPQVYGLLNSYHIIGLESAAVETRAVAFHEGQVHMVIFLFFVLLGAGAGQLMLEDRTVLPTTPVMRTYDSKAALRWLNALFVTGVAANVFLAQRLASVGGFRSALVKTTDGKIATSLVYFGGFALVVLVTGSIRNRNWVAAVLRSAVFGGAVLMTGSRGRLVWPLVIIAAVAVLDLGRLPRARALLWGTVITAVLFVMDPLSHYFVTGDSSQLSDSASLARIFEKRNFDGFSNLSIIVFEDRAPRDLSLITSGARDVFMNEYFPEVYEKGVGFGSTVPGWFFLSGGVLGLAFLSLFYGLGAACLNSWLRRQDDLIHVVGYLFAATWLGAVGGNFVESIDKAFTSVLPALTTSLFFAVSGVRRAGSRTPIEQSVPPASVAESILQ